MYNKALVSASDLPKTSDDMLAFEKRSAQAHPGQYGVVWNPEDPYDNAPWFYGFGASYVTPDGQAHLNTPQALAAMQYIASYRPYLPKQQSYDVASALFTEGKAAVIINGPWSYSDYATGGKNYVWLATLPIVYSNNHPAQPLVRRKTPRLSKTAPHP